MEDKYREVGENTVYLHVLISSIDCSFSPNKHLSNGETVTYGCEYNTYLARKLHMSFENTSYTYTVIGLLEEDPFSSMKETQSYEVEVLEDAENPSYTYTYTYIEDPSNTSTKLHIEATHINERDTYALDIDIPSVHDKNIYYYDTYRIQGK